MAVEPNVQPVPDSTFVNPQLDTQVTGPKQKQELDSSMSSFFKELDAKVAEEVPPPEEAPPPAVEEKPLEHELPEGVTEKSLEPPVTPSAPVPPSAPEPRPFEASDPLDNLEPHPDASPETKSQFGKLKEITKGLKEQTNAFRNTLAPVLRDLGINL